eukprot:1259407-Amphidinium_carterae.1
MLWLDRPQAQVKVYDEVVVFRGGLPSFACGFEYNKMFFHFTTCLQSMHHCKAGAPRNPLELRTWIADNNLKATEAVHESMMLSGHDL